HLLIANQEKQFCSFCCRGKSHLASFQVPAAWLTLCNQAFLILAIPILTSFLYPRLDRAGIRLSLFFRIALGMVFSTLAVSTAGGLESYRTYLWRNDPSSHIDLVIGNATYHAVDISIFWQVPQYVLVGAAEVFANIAGLEFAYTAAPATFQGLIMGLFYSLEGVASFLGILLLGLVSPYWFSDSTDYSNINDNHLDFYLYFLGIIQFCTLAAFAMVLYVRRFTLKLVGMPPLAEHPRLLQEAAGDGASGILTSMEEDNEELRYSSSMNEEDQRRPLIL
ncbi:UNVERIFIED_CONTAM: hypothetical protein GTU68_037102, partial [Idotea baltica]|nr:hypothetical protein [Idotea baltica]